MLEEPFSLSSLHNAGVLVVIIIWGGGDSGGGDGGGPKSVVIEGGGCLGTECAGGGLATVNDEEIGVVGW